MGWNPHLKNEGGSDGGCDGDNDSGELTIIVWINHVKIPSKSDQQIANLVDGDGDDRGDGDDDGDGDGDRRFGEDNLVSAAHRTWSSLAASRKLSRVMGRKGEIVSDATGILSRQ